MLSEADTIKPSEEEDRPSSNSSKKSVTLGIGNKIKSRIPHFERNGMQSEAVSRPTYETSSCISSNNNSARRPNIKVVSMSSSSKKPTKTISVDKRHLEIQYKSKKMRYATLKKTLVDKEKIARDLYNEMSNLREKIIVAGGKDPGKIEELRFFQVECPKQRSPTPVETSSQHDCTELQEPICMDESVVIGVSLLQSQLQSLCDRSQEICQHSLDKSSSFASLVKFWLTESTRQDGNMLIPVDYYSEVEARQVNFVRDNEELRTLLDNLQTDQKDFVAEFTMRSSRLCSEYDNYRERSKEERPNVDRGDLLQKQLTVALEELKTERDKASQGKDRTKVMELQMQKMQTRIHELEGHVANEEAKSQQLQSNVKSLEVQLKQKDQATELRMKDMHKTMKNSEILVAKLEKQRDSSETRMLELKEKMNSKEIEANTTIKELSAKFGTINSEFIEEREKRQQAERALNEMKERCKHLEEKSQLLCDLASQKSNNIVTDNKYTENEVCLYNDLMAARAELERHKKKIEQLEKEKQELVTVMHQAANCDNEDETKDTLAAELVAKTNDLQNLMLEHARLQKIARFSQERNEVLENQLSEIQHRLQARLKENGKTQGLDAVELQQQISDLRNNLAEVIQQNQELETTLTQKQLELEQRDRVMREQSKFLKVRDELLNLLKGNQANAANENYEDIDEINKQIIAKTEAIQELYATLESKQMQVMRLEKLVKLLEDQQDRAQAQRTRMEHRIAQLEVSLREKSRNDNNRSRAFGIL